jgi:hypothetical protein
LRQPEAGYPSSCNRRLPAISRHLVASGAESCKDAKTRRIRLNARQAKIRGLFPRKNLPILLQNFTTGKQYRQLSFVHARIEGYSESQHV